MKTRVLGWATALLPALVLSCQNPIGGTIGGSTNGTGDKPAAGPATADNTNTAAPSNTAAPAAPAAPTAMGGPDETAAPPSAATLTAVQDAQNRIAPMMNPTDSRIVFVNCADGSCSARLEAGSLVSMRNALQGVSSAYQGRVSFEVREHFDAYTGHSYHADVVLGTDTPTAVPTDETALMGAN